MNDSLMFEASHTEVLLTTKACIHYYDVQIKKKNVHNKALKTL